MSLKSQKRLAASLLGSGVNRVWIDPDDMEKVQSAITRQEIQNLIREGRIRARPKQGVSRGRARARAGRRKGPGRRKGGLGRRKKDWVLKIRAIRRHLRLLRDRRNILPENYRLLLGMAKGGAFRSSSHMDEYIKTRQLLRKR